MLAPRAGFEPAVRSNIFECRTGDSRAYSRPAPAMPRTGLYYLDASILLDWARARKSVLGKQATGKIASLNFPQQTARSSRLPMMHEPSFDKNKSQDSKD